MEREGVKRLDGRGHLFLCPFPKSLYVQPFPVESESAPLPLTLLELCVEERKGGTNRERGFLSWPPFFCTYRWPQLERGPRLTCWGAGSSCSPPAWEQALLCKPGRTHFSVGQGHFPSPLSRELWGLAAAQSGARETMPGVGNNAWLSFLCTHTPKQVFFSGSNWQLLGWVCKSENNSWRFFCVIPL